MVPSKTEILSEDWEDIKNSKIKNFELKCYVPFTYYICIIYSIYTYGLTISLELK